MPQQPDHSRFRPEDLTTRPVSSFRDLDAMTLCLESLLMRINEQREAIERKLVEFEGIAAERRFDAITTTRSAAHGPCKAHSELVSFYHKEFFCADTALPWN